MPGWKTNLTLAAATLGIAAWVGYRSERRTMDAAGKPATTIRSVVRHVMAPKSRKESFDRLHRLRHTSGRSQPTPREMQQCWDIVRGFTVEDVQAYLAEIPDGLRRPVNGALVTMLFYRWAQLDPEAAMNAARQPPYAEDRETHYAVAVAWVDRDIDGAMRWAMNGGSGFAKDIIENSVGQVWATQDPENALARAKAGSPGAVKGVLATLTEHLHGSKESRRKLFETLASLEDSGMKRRCLSQLVWCFEGKGEEARAAVAELEESGLLPDQLDAFRRDVVNYTMQGRPQERLEWVMNPESNADAGMQLNAYATWTWHEPDQAMKWAEEHGKIDFIGEIVKRQSFEQIRSGWQPGDKTRITWEEGLRHQISTWQKHQPEAADAWLQSLPADIRSHLTASHDDATNE